MTAHRADHMITGMFRDRESAERAYECLRQRGYSEDEISLLMSNDTRARHFPPNEKRKTELASKAPQAAGVGAAAGGSIGALLAGLAAAGIAVPGLPIIAMGPLAAALSGGAVGGVAGAIVGALVGRGIPEDRAKVYERGINEGGMVFGVTPRSDEDAEYIEREWRNARGEQIYRNMPQEAAGRRR